MTASTRFRAVVTALSALVAVLSSPQLLSAQASCVFPNDQSGCTLPSFNVSLTPTDVMRLTLGSTTTNLGAPVKADFSAGFIASTGPSLSIKANRNYRVTVEPTTQFFCVTSCPGAASTKPTSDLSWSTNGTSFTALTSTAAEDVTGGTLGTPSAGTGGPQATLSYRTSLSYAVDKPGTYAVVVTITLTAP